MAVFKQASTPDGARLVINTDLLVSCSETDIAFASLPTAVQTALGASGAGLQASNDFRQGSNMFGTSVFFSVADGDVPIA